MRISDWSSDVCSSDLYVCRTTGFRFGAFAYSTDVVTLDDRAFAMLDGVDTWVVGCLREAPHPCHAHLPRVLEWVDRLKPRRPNLTPMTHRIDYRTLIARLQLGRASCRESGCQYV